jgi:hypothetical protein
VILEGKAGDTEDDERTKKQYVNGSFSPGKALYVVGFIGHVFFS